MTMNVRATTLIALESALIVFAVAAGAAVRMGAAGASTVFAVHRQLLKPLLIAAVCQLCFYMADLYDLRVVTNRRELVIRTLQAVASTSMLLAVVYVWFPALVIGRGVFIVAALFVISLVAGWRIAFEWLARRAGPGERLLVVGTKASAVTLAKELHARRLELGVEIVGFIDGDARRVGESLFNPRILGTPADIPALVRAHRIDRVVVCPEEPSESLPIDRLLDMRFAGIAFEPLPSAYERYLHRFSVGDMRPTWLIFSPGFRATTGVMIAKRAFDVVVSGVALVVWAPLLALVAFAVRLTSRGPVFYHQVRVGRNGRLFTLHKFRSMHADAEAGTGAVWAHEDDPRLTSIGSFLRKARLDELPQLWNVLIGEMSLVGPRPERPEFVDQLAAEVPYYRQRHAVKPGLSGWAQVRYSYGASVADAIEKLQYDLFYIKHLSLAFDLLVILKTVKTVVLRRGT